MSTRTAISAGSSPAIDFQAVRLTLRSESPHQMPAEFVGEALQQFVLMTTAKIAYLGADPVVVESSTRASLRRPTPVQPAVQIQPAPAAPVFRAHDADHGVHAQILDQYRGQAHELATGGDGVERSRLGVARMQASSRSPATRRSAPASAIMAPLSVQNSGRGKMHAGAALAELGLKSPGAVADWRQRHRRPPVTPGLIQRPQAFPDRVSTTASSKPRAISAELDSGSLRLAANMTWVFCT